MLPNRLSLIAQRAVIVLFALQSLLLCGIAKWRYTIFRDDVDLGIFTQVIDSLGRGFSSTAEGGASHLLAHWSPIVAVGWPFVRAFGPVGLQYAQAVLAAAVVFPVWGLAKSRFRPLPALAITFVAAIYPLLWANGAADFHEMAFVPVLSATLAYALDRRRWAMAIACSFLLLCTKEDQFVILTINGLLFISMSRNDLRAQRIGTAICLSAVAMAVLYFGFVRLALDPHIAYGSLKFYDWRATSTAHGDIAAALTLRLRYVFVVLAPLAFLPCFSRYGLFLIAGLVEILASSQPVTILPGAHYGALLTGYALAAFVDGAANVAGWRPAFAKAAIAIAATLTIGIQAFGSPMEYWYYLYRLPNDHDARLQQVLSRLPRSADVGSEDEIFAHLGLNPRASVTFHDQQWFVYDATHFSPRWNEVDAPAVARAVASKQYAVRYADDDIVVVEKRGHGAGGSSSNLRLSPDDRVTGVHQPAAESHQQQALTGANSAVAHGRR